jgi:ferredoxin, 2Fe-2S
MGGRNPYIHEQEAELPRQVYTLVVIDEGGKEHSIEVDPAKLPCSDHGQPGSILDVCLGHGIELDHACGGVCACATCHVHVLEGVQACSESTEEEEDQLEEACDLKPNSRLACQCVPNGSCTVKVHIPSWNRNLAREAHSAETMTTRKDA